jgi:Protein of unknown function (DUF1360)
MTALYRFILGVLDVWRITDLLNAEDGPGRIFARLRRCAGSGFWGDLLDCFYCLSLWVAAPFVWVLATGWRARLLLWPALSAAASLLERIQTPPAPHYTEEPLQPDL